MRPVSGVEKKQIRVGTPTETERGKEVTPSEVVHEGERLALPELSEEERETLARMSDFMGRRY